MRKQTAEHRRLMDLHAVRMKEMSTYGKLETKLAQSFEKTVPSKVILKSV